MLLNRMSQDTDSLGYSDYYNYDADGNLIRKIDRDGRITRYTYDNLNRETAETWQEETTAPEITGEDVLTTITRLASSAPIRLPPIKRGYGLVIPPPPATLLTQIKGSTASWSTS